MNFSLKPHPLVAQWVPGFMVLSFFLSVIYFQDGSALVKTLNEVGTPVCVLILVVMGFVVGQFLDASRDVLEDE